MFTSQIYFLGGKEPKFLLFILIKTYVSYVHIVHIIQAKKPTVLKEGLWGVIT